ncbi:MAG: tetratricopeptide repeat protein [Chthoniobacterales bacterium]
MDGEQLISPTPPPDKMFRIVVWVVVAFGAAELAGLGVFYAGKWRAEYVAAHPKPIAPAATPAPTAPAVAEKTTPAPPTTATTPAVAPPAASTQTTPSTAALSIAEKLLKEATELRDKGDTTNALARLQDAAQRDPKNANVLAEMAMIYESIQLFERSNDTWKKIQEIGPSAGPLYELADMKLKTGVTPPAAPATTTTTGPGLAGSSPLDAGTNRNDADGIPDGSTFGITEVSAVDSPDADAETNMKLKISVKARPNTPIDHTKVKIQVFFYDTVDNKEVVLTDADVSYEWVTPRHDWKDTNPEILAVTYLRPKNKTSSDAALAAAAASITPPSTSKKKPTTKAPASDAGADGHRKYLGYIVRIYYNDQLQAVRADPTKLLNLFPPPFTAPQ